jgi:hypothetical protein
MPDQLPFAREELERESSFVPIDDLDAWHLSILDALDHG